MNPNLQGNALAVLQEEARKRFGGTGTSTVGMSPNPSASNPITPQQTGTQPLAESMYKGATNMMNGAKTGGAELITKALIQRLKQYPTEAF